ncbi:Rhoptry kinase family protein ROP17, putative [Eimeria tenella]|uniref:Rhoptry kinase family protein ROP17, putative n=1 Tax=Eimeria tenella TaxID=5802 RepID=U6KG78_EIMTE|nr:Rhoptry kinase family protein ROP17, putative [Eimeria tenella]CDJ37045.1 Rhoptry kinase family protein ROP17, putative [Eimeria tenella]|eukprot:XP_013227883.1 Rhoptry kinase family protein ROP17, putative [Eimeria tenella]
MDACFARTVVLVATVTVAMTVDCHRAPSSSEKPLNGYTSQALGHAYEGLIFAQEKGNDTPLLHHSRRLRQNGWKNRPHSLQEQAGNYNTPLYGLANIEENSNGYELWHSTRTPDRRLGEEANASFALLSASPPGSAKKGGSRSNLRKSGESGKGTSSPISIFKAIGRPFASLGAAALRATGEIRKLLFKPKMSCKLELKDNLIGGHGSPIVAKAISRLPLPKTDRRLLAVEEGLDVHFPRDQDITFDCVGYDQSIVLRRGALLGAGNFGYVFSLTSRHGAQYAGKIYAIQQSEKHTMDIAKDQLKILNYLPPNMDAATALHTLHLSLPLCVISKRYAPAVLDFPNKKQILNAIVLYPRLRMDLVYLSASLFNYRPEDREVLMILTQQVVTAVNDLHSLHLVHFDIKPQNFLLTENGSVMAADLDGAKRVGSPVMPVLYTIAFAAPELAEIIANINEDAQAEYTMDSWPLGMTIYSLWCLNLPLSKEFRSLPPSDRLISLYKSPQDALLFDQECTAKMPPMVLDLITKFMKINPKERLTPAQAVASHPVMQRKSEGEAIKPLINSRFPAKASAPSTVSTDTGGPSLTSSYVFVTPKMVEAGQSFEQQVAKTAKTENTGFELVGSYLRNLRPLNDAQYFAASAHSSDALWDERREVPEGHSSETNSV